MLFKKKFNPASPPVDVSELYNTDYYIPKRIGNDKIVNEWFWSDLHIDHDSCLRPRGWTGTLSEYQDHIAFLWDNVVGENDVIHLVGDIALTWAGLRWLKDRPGKKILYMGNHDTERENTIRDLLSAYDDVRGFWRHKKGFYIGHCPSHPTELRGKRMIHGHKHQNVIQDQRYINVCLDLLPNGPVNIKDLVNGDYRSYKETEQ